MPIHARTGWGRHNGPPDSKWERRGGSSLFEYTIGRAPQCFVIETFHSIDRSSDIVFGYVRSQELRGRGMYDCCRHGALHRDKVSHRIAEIGPDRFNEILRTTA